MNKFPLFRLGDICRIEKGETGLASAVPGEFPLVATSAERKTCQTYQFDTSAVCIPLVSSTGHGKKTLNYLHFQSGKFALGTILAAVIPNNPQQLSASYLHRYLQFNKDKKLVSLMKGAANVSLAVKDIAKVEIPVPPIEDQRVFVELFNKLEDSGKKLNNEFQEQSSYLTQLRQAIIQEAIEGKLTAGWRKENPVVLGDPDTDAVALLAKIKAEKERFVAEGKIKKQKPLAPIKPEDVPFALPEGWVWTRLGEVIKNPPRNGYSPREVSYPTNIKTLKLGATTRGFFNASQFKFVDEEISKNSVFWLKPNDILIQRSNSIDYVGVSAIFSGAEGEFIYPDLMMKLEILDSLNISFSHKVLTSPFNRKYYREKASGAQKSMPKINQGIVNDTYYPLPPLAEQKVIVDRVEKLLSMVDELEQQIVQRKDQAQALLQTVLAEAFEGKGT